MATGKPISGALRNDFRRFAPALSVAGSGAASDRGEEKAAGRGRGAISMRGDAEAISDPLESLERPVLEEEIRIGTFPLRVDHDAEREG